MPGIIMSRTTTSGAQAANSSKPSLSAVGLDDSVAALPQRQTDHSSNAVVVIHHENGGHSAPHSNQALLSSGRRDARTGSLRWWPTAPITSQAQQAAVSIGHSSTR